MGNPLGTLRQTANDPDTVRTYIQKRNAAELLWRDADAKARGAAVAAMDQPRDKEAAPLTQAVQEAAGFYNQNWESVTNLADRQWAFKRLIQIFIAIGIPLVALAATGLAAHQVDPSKLSPALASLRKVPLPVYIVAGGLGGVLVIDAARAGYFKTRERNLQKDIQKHFLCHMPDESGVSLWLTGKDSTPTRKTTMVDGFSMMDE